MRRLSNQEGPTRIGLPGCHLRLQLRSSRRVAIGVGASSHRPLRGFWPTEAAGESSGVATQATLGDCLAWIEARSTVATSGLKPVGDAGCC